MHFSADLSDKFIENPIKSITFASYILYLGCVNYALIHLMCDVADLVWILQNYLCSFFSRNKIAFCMKTFIRNRSRI